MKHMNIRLSLACICLFAGINAFAYYTACIDGIYYYFSGDEATVTYGDSPYSGTVFIPCFVTYNGKTYRVSTIGERAFHSSPDVISVTIPTYVTRIEENAFYFLGGYDESQPVEINCYAVVVPDVHIHAFSYYRQNVTLRVPPSALEDYAHSIMCAAFFYEANITTLDIEPADNISMSYSNGELKFNHDGIINCNITCSDPGRYFCNDLSLSLTYNITAYHTREWMDRGETVQGTLCWINTTPEKEGDIHDTSTPVEEVEAQPVLIQSQGSTICVDGAPEGTTITLYSTDGKQLDTAVASKGQTSLDGSRLSGSIAIVKIGDRSIKAKIK